jgi:DNA-binding transcriptional LysR family regulator
MDLDQLRSFVTIAREQSFTRAAEKLFLTQSALSQQMKVLEQQLGEPLFERHGRQLLLTAAGQIIQEQATTILGLVEQMTQEVAALQGLAQGRIRIGASDTICLYLLPPIVQRLRTQYRPLRST